MLPYSSRDTAHKGHNHILIKLGRYHTSKRFEYLEGVDTMSCLQMYICLAGAGDGIEQLERFLAMGVEIAYHIGKLHRLVATTQHVTQAGKRATTKTNHRCIDPFLAHNLIQRIGHMIKMRGAKA